MRYPLACRSLNVILLYVRAGTASLDRPEMSHTALTVPFMNEPPRRHDVTIRVAKEAGHLTDPAAFATAASRAAACRNASILSAHTAGEIICVVGVPASGARDAVAVALAWLTRSRPGIRCRHPAG